MKTSLIAIDLQCNKGQYRQSGSSFAEFEPVLRRPITEDAAQLEPERVQQLRVLIADKQAGFFRLEVDWIMGFK